LSDRKLSWPNTWMIPQAQVCGCPEANGLGRLREREAAILSRKIAELVGEVVAAERVRQPDGVVIPARLKVDLSGLAQNRTTSDSGRRRESGNYERWYNI
jgi:hypothetical protein